MKRSAKDMFGKYRLRATRIAGALRAGRNKTSGNPWRVCRAVLTALFLAGGSLGLSCGLTETDYQPWYYVFIQDRVDLAEHFPREYQSQAVIIKTLYVGSTAYTVLYQNRQPNGSPFAIILDKDLSVLTSFTDSRLQNPDSWYAAPDGTLRLGYLTLTPPSATVATWTRTLNSVAGYGTYSETRTSIGGQMYDLHLSLSDGGDLMLPFTSIASDASTGQPQQYPVIVRDAALNTIAVTANDKLLIPGFVAQNRTKLFPLAQTGQLYAVAVRSVSFGENYSDMRIAAKLTPENGNYSSGESMYFMVRVTLPAGTPYLETLPDDMSGQTVSQVMDESQYFDLNSMSNYGSNSTAVVTADALLGFYNNGVPKDGDKETMPYTTALDIGSGNLQAFKLPRNENSEGGPYPPNPQYQNGSDLWFVWDGRASRLFRNAPWWKAQ